MRKSTFVRFNILDTSTVEAARLYGLPAVLYGQCICVLHFVFISPSMHEKKPIDTATKKAGMAERKEEKNKNRWELNQTKRKEEGIIAEDKDEKN